MSISPLEKPENLNDEKVAQLKALFPQAFSEGKLNLDALKEELGDLVDELPEGEEHYGLNWPGKRDAKKLATLPPTGTLKPIPGEGVNEETTKNLIIEGDNLEVLRIMQKAYAGRIKMIYIDPPYNTGNDFVYKDDFKEPVESYLRKSGQADDEGLLTANPKASGRFHSNWLNMMYPRLRLARNLLKDDGVIFVSVDDNEAANLKNLLDSIFGEEKFISQLVWKSRQNKDNRNSTNVSIDHEYVICYGNKVRGDERDLSQYSNPDNDPRGDWTSANMVGLQPEENRPNLHYILVNPATGIEYPKPDKGWRYDRNTMAELIEDNRILWPADPSGRPRRKVFLKELSAEYTGYSSVVGTDLYTRDGTADVENLFDAKVMDFPKLVKLIEDLIVQGMDNQSGIVLDFFAGSGTTAESVFELNALLDLKFQFICVQLPEPTAPGSAAKQFGFETISDLTQERIRRVARSHQIDENSDKQRGFRVYQLSESSFRKWTDFEGTDPQALGQLFESLETPFVDGWTPEGVLTEVMLLEGFPLDSDVLQAEDFPGTVTRVKHPDLDLTRPLAKVMNRGWR